MAAPIEPISGNRVPPRRSLFFAKGEHAKLTDRSDAEKGPKLMCFALTHPKQNSLAFPINHHSKL